MTSDRTRTEFQRVELHRFARARAGRNGLSAVAGVIVVHHVPTKFGDDLGNRLHQVLSALIDVESAYVCVLDRESVSFWLGGEIGVHT